MNRIAITIAGVLLAGAAPALSQGQQSRVLPVSADAAFVHANSGITLPATLVGLPRFEVRELEQPQLDVWARYRRENGEELTVYVYRTTAGAVPVWFDRAIWAIESRGTYSTPAPVGPPAPVTIPGSATAAGLTQSWSVTTGPYKGTGVLVAPLGDWLVKLRYSTTSGDGAVAAAKLRDVVAALGWPATIPAAPAATTVADCPGALAFKGTARNAKVDGASALLGAMLGGMAPSATDPKEPPAIWCRDATALTGAGVYRPDADPERYLLALSDAGRGVRVGPNLAGVLMGKGKPNWAVDLILPGSTENYPPQDRLPTPQRVIELLNAGPVSSMTTWGGKSDLTLSPKALK